MAGAELHIVHGAYGRNGCDDPVYMTRLAVFDRLAGYRGRQRRGPARAVGLERLANDKCLAAISNLLGLRVAVLIVDDSLGVSPTSGDQDGAAYNCHFACIYYHPVFVSDQFGDLDCDAPVATRGAFVSFSISRAPREQ